MKRAIFLSIILFSNSAFGEEYANYFGDGLRLYAQGHYNDALESLYRAYAIKPSAEVLNIIVRTHDFAGQCSAVERQLTLFKELFPREKSPKAQLCAEPGELRIECTPHASQVMINHTMRAHCGTTIKVPEGTHTVHSDELNEAKTFAVKKGETTVAKLQLVPQKWATQVDKLDDFRPYTAIKSADGLFEIWVRSSLRDDPEMGAEIRVPGFTIVRSTDGLYDISSDELKPVEPGRRPLKPAPGPKIDIPALMP